MMSNNITLHDRDINMQNLPSFLKNTSIRYDEITTDEETRSYNLIQANWLLKMALLLNWIEDTSDYRSNHFYNSDVFLNIVKIKIQEFELVENQSKLISAIDQPVYSKESYIAAFKKRLEQISNEVIFENLPLFNNVKALGDLLGLSEAAKAILAFTSILEYFFQFHSIISEQSSKISNKHLNFILANILGYSEEAIKTELNAESPLIESGLISLNSEIIELENKLSMTSRLANIMTEATLDKNMILNDLLKRTGKTNLVLNDFPHLKKDIDTLKKYISNALKLNEIGVNILIYGKPGTGKTEFIKALSQDLNVNLYEIAFADADGNPLDGKSRLNAYNLSQRILRHQNNTLLMFDEIEDVIEDTSHSLFKTESSITTKAWLNRTLERNKSPAFWITNDPFIDEAYLRRFDYSIHFKIPPINVRLEVARRYLSQFNPTEEWLKKIASNEKTSPAQYEIAAKVVRVIDETDQASSWDLIEQTLDRSSKLLNHNESRSRNTIHTQYDVTLINSDHNIMQITEALKLNQSGTFCFYGPPGTGKSELARYIADEIQLPIIVKRASDILDPWLGGTEKNLAEMFEQAHEENAVLVLDEADSFLQDRRDANKSWEITQVNELLTQMEAFNGIFVCTTNLINKLDQASLRRFAFKIKFDYLTTDQKWEMFKSVLIKLGNNLNALLPLEKSVRSLNNLTPGDFSVVNRKVKLMEDLATPIKFLESLALEVNSKSLKASRIGF